MPSDSHPDTSRPRLSRRLRSRIGQEARDLLNAGPPTLDLLAPIGPQVPDDAHVQQVLDFCMRIGEVLLSSGETSTTTTAAMIKLANAAGLPTVDVGITFSSITMCCHRGMTAAPVTSMRQVQRRTLDLKRLLAAGEITRRFEDGKLDLRDASNELAEVVAAPHPYPRWVATAGWALMAAAVALMLGAAPSTAGAAFVVTAVIDRTSRALGKWGLPAFFLQMMGGLLATSSAIALFATGAFPPGTRPSLVVAAGITVLLSGLTVVGTVQDAIAGNYVTAAGRAVEIGLLSAGLLTGVVLALKIGFEFGLALEVAGELPSAERFWLAIGMAATVSAAYALAGYAPVRSLVVAALAGAAGWGMYSTLTQVAAIGPIAATGIAAIIVGAATGLLRRGGGVPPLVVTLAGITPLLPGFTAYRGFYQLAVEGVADGLITVTVALGVGLALAAGVAFGDFLTQPRDSSSMSPEDAAPQ